MTIGRLTGSLFGLVLFLTSVSVHAQKVPFEGAEQTIPWVKKRLGRFLQSNQWARLDELSRNALEVAIENDLADLKMETQWYRTLVVAQMGGAPEKVLEELEKAIDCGYRSVQGIESADQLAVLRADPATEPRFRQLLTRLRETVRFEARTKYQSTVSRQIEQNKAAAPPSLGVHGLLKPDGSAAGTEGRPMIVVLSRTYHAGLRKQWPALEGARGPFQDRVTALALFYVSDVESEFIQDEAARFARLVGVDEGSYALIDRETYKQLEAGLAKLHESRQADAKVKTVFDLYFPFTFIVDGSGRPLFAESGALSDEEIAYALEKALEGLPVPPPVESGAPGEEGSAASDSERESESKTTATDSESATDSDSERASDSGSEPDSEPEPEAEPGPEPEPESDSESEPDSEPDPEADSDSGSEHSEPDSESEPEPESDSDSGSESDSDSDSGSDDSGAGSESDSDSDSDTGP